MRADQLALVAAQAMRAGGADLAVVFDRRFSGADRIVLWKIRSNFIIKDAWSGGKHG
jgi:hypothetical protein